MNDVTEANEDSGVSTDKKCEDMFDLIKKIDICMMTTHSADGLVTRPMSTQMQDDNGDLWFMTTIDTHKVDELLANPQVSLAYFKDGEWVSVTGTARMVHDKSLINEMYRADWKAWLPDEGGNKDGGPNDPRIVLLEVSPSTIHYFVRTTPKPLVSFKIAKAALTGSPPKIGEERHIERDELRDG
jgi:general stress protein 26